MPDFASGAELRLGLPNENDGAVDDCTAGCAADCGGVEAAVVVAEPPNRVAAVEVWVELFSLGLGVGSSTAYLTASEMSGEWRMASVRVCSEVTRR